MRIRRGVFCTGIPQSYKPIFAASANVVPRGWSSFGLWPEILPGRNLLLRRPRKPYDQKLYCRVWEMQNLFHNFDETEMTYQLPSSSIFELSRMPDVTAFFVMPYLLLVTLDSHSHATIAFKENRARRIAFEEPHADHVRQYDTASAARSMVRLFFLCYFWGKQLIVGQKTTSDENTRRTKVRSCRYLHQLFLALCRGSFFDLRGWCSRSIFVAAFQ